MKKVFAKMAIGVLMCGCLSGSVYASTGENVPWGDVNADGEVDMDDVLLLLKSALHIDATLENEKAVDYNQDGEVNLADASQCLEAVLHIQPQYSGRVVSYSVYNGKRELLLEGDKEVDLNYLTITDNITISTKDGKSVSEEDLVEGVSILYDRSLILEVYPGIIIGCTRIQVQ